MNAILKSPEEIRKRLANKLSFSSSATGALDPEQLDIAYQLAQNFGRIRVAREESGLHFYMASPACLEEDGKVEFTKMHLAVNVDKYLLYQRDRCAMCMKTGTPYKMTELLAMAPLAQRGYKDQAPVVEQFSAAPMEFLEPDANGNMVPKSPGLTVPVHELEPGHAARFYVENRGFDPVQLWDQFGLSYCYEDRQDVWYGKMLYGFKAGPLGRIIFNIDQYGMRRGWQARILDYADETTRSYFHPTENQWMAVEQKVDGKWQPLPGWEGWDPKKYVIGRGCKRNQCLMGFDAAVDFASKHRDRYGRKYCILCEGPLDAGRVGPPGLALMGKYCSQFQAELLCNEFDRVIFITQNDNAGKEAQKKVAQQIGNATNRVSVDFPELPGAYKDIGEMTYKQAEAFLESII